MTTATMTDAVKQAADEYHAKKKRLTEEERKLQELYRRHRELTERLDAFTDAHAKVEEARVDAGIKFATGEFSEGDVVKAKRTCEEGDRVLAELHELIHAIVDGIARIERKLPELRNQLAPAEGAIWRAAMAAHKEATPAEVVRWVERGHALIRMIGFTAVSLVSLNIPEVNSARLAVVEKELRREFGLLSGEV